jgi:DNA repair exonuclease SbcCD ATPase subunit
MENNIDNIVEKETKFCEENKFEKNEQGVFIYKSSNGFSSINLPYILKDYVDQYLENNRLHTTSDLRDEWRKGYDEGYDEGCDERCNKDCKYVFSSYESSVTLKELEYEYSVKTIKIKTPYDEMKFNLVKDMFDRFDLNQLEKLSSNVTEYDKLEKKYEDLEDNVDNVDSLQNYVENNYIDDYAIENLIHKIESLKY